MTKRKSELSILNIIMFLLVMLIHVISWTINNLDKNSLEYVSVLVPWRLSAFVVQGFIFISAVKLFASKKEANYEKFLFGRYIKIIIPYILWVFIYYAYFIKHYGYVFSWNDVGSYIVFGTICSHFYFIVTIMQFYFNLPLFKYIMRKETAVFMCIASVIFTVVFKHNVHFQYDDRIFLSYLCYFVLGAAVGMNYERACELIRKYLWLASIVFVIFAFLDSYIVYRTNVLGIPFVYVEAVHILYCIAAIFFFFGWCLFFFEGKKLPRFVQLLDRSSYTVYLSHVLFIYIANSLIWNRGIENVMLQFALRFVFTYVVTIAFSVVWTLIAEKMVFGTENSEKGRKLFVLFGKK